jgi:hypothetical protein
MFQKDQIENKIDVVDKRTYNTPLVIVPTSLLTTQKLARLGFQRMKKFKFSWRSREAYQL